MKNNFQSNGKGRNQRVWKLLISMLIILTMGIGQMWAADPTVNAELSGSTKADYFKLYEGTGVTLSTDQSMSSGAVQIGTALDASASTLAYYYGISSEDAAIDSIAVLFSGNGSNKKLYPALLGYEEASGYTAASPDTVIIHDEVTSSANSKAAAVWCKYDLSNANIKGVLIVKQFKKVAYSKGGVTYAKNTTYPATSNTLKCYHIKVWVRSSTSYTVTLNPNNGSYASTPSGWTASGGNYTKTVTAGDLAIPEPTRESYEFNGWESGTVDVALTAGKLSVNKDTTLTAQWTAPKATPTVTFNDGNYVVGAAALNLSGLFESQNTSDVSFALKVASEDAAISGSSFTATKAGSYVVVATQAADANYKAVEKEATITVTYPATGAATITYNLDVTNNGTTLQTLATTNANSSSISVSASNSLLAGGLGTGGSHSADKNKHNGTRTLGINTLAEETADKYFYVTFTVASGHEFTPSAISLKTLTIGGNATSYKAVLTDGVNSIVGTVNATNDSEVTLGSWTGLGTTTLSGTVTLKLYAWYTTSGTYNAYRLSTPITITGTVAAEGACTAPTDVTISANGGAAHIVGDDVTLTASASNVSASTEYAWYKGATLEAAEAVGAIQTAKTATNNGHKFTINGCTLESAGTYWCVVWNAEGCETSASLDLTVSATHTVTYMPNGGSGPDIIDANAITIADCVFGTPENKLFDRWNATAEGDGANYTVGADVNSNLVLYAIWKDDECTTNRKSIFKAVLTGDNTATVTGENDKEYAGEVKLNKLGGSASNRNTDATIEGVGEHLTTYKMNGTGAYMYGTLKKGAFQEGDKIQFAVSYTPNTLAIYGAKSSDLSQRVHIANMPAPNAAKVYTYTLTAANATALAGYDAIGIYREDGVTMNPFLYSLEITGCRDWTILYSVSFDLNGQTSASPAPADQSIGEGGLVTKPTDPAVDGYYFRGWYKEAACTNAWDFANDAVGTEDVVLYAKWEADPCTDRQSISKVVLTSASAGTVTGYNNDEYAGAAIINNLGGSGGSATYDFGDGVVTGYKLAGTKSTLMATLAKGQFHEGDKVVIAITQKASNNKLEIYAGSDINNTMLVKEIDAAAAGIYTYTLTDADATAINAAGHKSIGTFRGSYNPFVYSVEITGCRSWVTYHTLTFKNIDGSATIAAPALAEDAYAITVAPAAPIVDGKKFLGWSESKGGAVVDLATYAVTTDGVVLYAVYGDCPTSGTIFKFSVATGKTNGSIFATTPNSMELTTANYLASVVDCKVVAAVSGSDNNRIQYYDEKGLGFANGDQGSITITFDCPIAEGDLVRCINYANSNNKLKITGDTHYELLDGNGAETIQELEVPAEWDGLRELVLSRGNNNPKITYFEVYRRPALESVTLEDMNLKVGKTGTPVMTPTPADALITSQAWEITASTATGTTINASTGLITAGATAGEVTVQVTLNGDKVATFTVKIVQGFETLRPVTGTQVWNWEPVAVSSNGPEISAPDTVLANYLSGEEWEMLSGNAGGRPYRDNSSNKAYQGTSLYFINTVPGMLIINARSTGSTNKAVYVNGHEVGSIAGSRVYLDTIALPAGAVKITSEAMRIYWMKFDADFTNYKVADNVLGGNERPVTEGRYGTICLPNGGVMVGASVFEIAYMDYKDNKPFKIYFDEIANGTMIAGRPYIFLPNESVTRLGVFYTDAAGADAGNYRGLYGSYSEINLTANDGNYILLNNMYYYVNSDNVYCSPNRAYIKLADVPDYDPSKPAYGRRRVALDVHSEQVATGIGNTELSEQPMKVMINGQLYILRGEQMFDATGRLVK